MYIFNNIQPLLLIIKTDKSVLDSLIPKLDLFYV